MLHQAEPAYDVVLEAAASPEDDVVHVGYTSAAVHLLRQLWQRHGPLMFHQSGGCCDGSAPMCFPAGEFRIGDADVLLGAVELVDSDGTVLGPLELYISREQFGVWKHTALIIDAVPGRGSGFSLEAPTGHRFLVRSTLCSTA
ncbi:MAG: DUF779 domain-containing protein [Kocuria sp.]|nr:DUF779 domain-containing protein [Kocuria sp.]